MRSSIVDSPVTQSFGVGNFETPSAASLDAIKRGPNRFEFGLNSETIIQGVEKSFDARFLESFCHPFIEAYVSSNPETDAESLLIEILQHLF
jgi:hypothetical protein